MFKWIKKEIKEWKEAIAKAKLLESYVKAYHPELYESPEEETCKEFLIRSINTRKDIWKEITEGD